jgi:Raf kinase inhibitor-like YbhB/YbcL family protein
MDDPDVPKHLKADGMWDHWIVFNMSANLTHIEEGKEPEGIHGIGTSGNLNYYGPCPPDREHRYFFKLYALDTQLNLPERATKKQVEQAMKAHVLAEAELMGRYTRI